MNEEAPAPAAQALASLAVSAALMEALLKRGVIDQADVDPIMKDAGSYVAAFCTGCSPEVEREAQRLLTLIATAEREVRGPEPEAEPVPVAEPASS
jgi:hypothetical protein